MGVSYLNAVDIVDRINASFVATERVSDFNSGVEFYGALTVPLDHDWVVKLEYAYLLASFKVTSLYPGSDFSIHAHLPTVIAQYVLVDHVLYNVKAGFGIGYHFGSYSERYSIVDAQYTGNGLGAKLDLEANTAFGEHIYGYLGGDLRWEFIGTLSDKENQSSNVGVLPTMHLFSIGAKLGFTYLF